MHTTKIMTCMMAALAATIQLAAALSHLDGGLWRHPTP